MRYYGERVTLRGVEFEDLETILQWENDPELAPYSDPHEPYTETQILFFIIEQRINFEAQGQLRLMICVGKRVVGAIDVFNFDEENADVGVLIYDKSDRRQGYATDAVKTLIKKVLCELGITTLWAIIDQRNIASTALFRKCGFTKVDKNRYKYEQSCSSVDSLSRLWQP